MHSATPIGAILVLHLALLAAAGAGEPAAPPPASLHETGLYLDATARTIRPGILSFTPQYPLWSDGAVKRRFIELPVGESIDATRPAAWQFPPGTRLWKEFSVDGRPVETRLIERLDTGEWRFAAYAWNAAGTAAPLAPVEGIRALPLPGGGTYTVPSVSDCRACHEGPPVPVLGFTALQLSGDRDPLAPNAELREPADVDLAALVARGLLRGLPGALLETPPRIRAPTPAGRAVLGYLHANCGHCHGDAAVSDGFAPVPLQLWLDPVDPDAAPRVLRELLDATGRYRLAGEGGEHFIVPGDANAGTLLTRMRALDPRVQMPPLGRRIPDSQALALIARWVEEDITDLKEVAP